MKKKNEEGCSGASSLIVEMDQFPEWVFPTLPTTCWEPS